MSAAGADGRRPAVILDVDGTLVDTNHQPALAWFRALRRHGVAVPVAVIHRHIGMGGDRIVAAIAGGEVEERLGDAVREAEGECFREIAGEVVALPGARDLVDGWTDSPDVEATKPAPDLLDAALDRVGGRPAVLVGDSVWDCRAARRAGLPAIGVESGGVGAAELREAGALEVLPGVEDVGVALLEAAAR